MNDDDGGEGMGETGGAIAVQIAEAVAAKVAALPPVRWPGPLTVEGKEDDDDWSGAPIDPGVTPRSRSDE